MAVTLEQIEVFLKQKGMNYQRDSEKDAIVSGVGDSDNSAYILIRAKDDGKNFNLQMEPLNKDKSNMFDIDANHPHILKALMYLLHCNYQMKYGNWEYDFNDGDLRFAVEIPLEDSQLTYAQFEKIVSVCFTALGDVDGIHHILSTGEMPKQKSSDDVLADTLRKMLAQLEAKSSSDSDGI